MFKVHTTVPCSFQFTAQKEISDYLMSNQTNSSRFFRFMWEREMKEERKEFFLFDQIHERLDSTHLIDMMKKKEMEKMYHHAVLQHSLRLHKSLRSNFLTGDATHVRTISWQHLVKGSTAVHRFAKFKVQSTNSSNRRPFRNIFFLLQLWNWIIVDCKLAQSCERSESENFVALDAKVKNALLVVLFTFFSSANHFLDILI